MKWLVKGKWIKYLIIIPTEVDYVDDKKQMV
jgi:hypothetical protein